MRGNVLLVSALAVCLGVQFIHSQSQPPPVAKGSSGPQFVMGPNFVNMPEGFFVLVRKGREIGAFRLIHIKQDAHGLGTATHESYFQANGSGSFQNAGVIKRTGEIESNSVKGLSHSLSWRPGQKKLWVGKWWFGCSSPSLVNMSAHFSENDQGYEFAPTSAQSVDKIDVLDKRLKWFRFNADARIVVTVSELPE